MSGWYGQQGYQQYQQGWYGQGGYQHQGWSNQWSSHNAGANTSWKGPNTSNSWTAPNYKPQPTAHKGKEKGKGKGKGHRTLVNTTLTNVERSELHGVKEEYEPTMTDIHNLIARIFSSEYGKTLHNDFAAIKDADKISRVTVCILPGVDSRFPQSSVSSLVQHQMGPEAWSKEKLSKVVNERVRELKVLFPQKSDRELMHMKLMPNLYQLSKSAPLQILRRNFFPEMDSFLREFLFPKFRLHTERWNVTRQERKMFPPQLMTANPFYPMNYFLASPDEMILNGFPELCCSNILNLQDYLPDEWVCAPKKTREDLAPDWDKMIAIDCEMVQAQIPNSRHSDDNALARMTVIDSGKTVLVDMYVQPRGAVTNYKTEFSGITVDDLAGVTETLQDAQKKMLEILTPRTVIVGHSLENDLKALKLVHPWIVDTTLLYPHVERGKKMGLQALAKRFLNLQMKRSNGHNSVEDARVALDLVKQKIDKGIYHPDYSPPFHDEIMNLGALGKKERFRTNLYTEKKISSADLALPTTMATAQNWDMLQDITCWDSKSHEPPTPKLKPVKEGDEEEPASEIAPLLVEPASTTSATASSSVEAASSSSSSALLLAADKSASCVEAAALQLQLEAVDTAAEDVSEDVSGTTNGTRESSSSPVEEGEEAAPMEVEEEDSATMTVISPATAAAAAAAAVAATIPPPPSEGTTPLATVASSSTKFPSGKKRPLLGEGEDAALPSAKRQKQAERDEDDRVRQILYNLPPAGPNPTPGKLDLSQQIFNQVLKEDQEEGDPRRQLRIIQFDRGERCQGYDREMVHLNALDRNLDELGSRPNELFIYIGLPKPLEKPAPVDKSFVEAQTDPAAQAQQQHSGKDKHKGQPRAWVCMRLLPAANSKNSSNSTTPASTPVTPVAPQPLTKPAGTEETTVTAAATASAPASQQATPAASPAASPALTPSAAAAPSVPPS